MAKFEAQDPFPDPPISTFPACSCPAPSVCDVAQNVHNGISGSCRDDSAEKGTYPILSIANCEQLSSSVKRDGNGDQSKSSSARATPGRDCTRRFRRRQKADYLRKLIAAGFTHIDAVSFVSPAAIPQMADSEQVLELLMPPEHVEIIGIVVNQKGAERAIRTGAVQTLGFPYSISAEFLQRNQHQTLEESLEALERPSSSWRTMPASMSWPTFRWPSAILMANHGAWTKLSTACDLLADSGMQAISLADTVGVATVEHRSMKP